MALLRPYFQQVLCGRRVHHVLGHGERLTLDEQQPHGPLEVSLCAGRAHANDHASLQQRVGTDKKLGRRASSDALVGPLVEVNPLGWLAQLQTLPLRLDHLAPQVLAADLPHPLRQAWVLLGWHSLPA